jgi:hypothetical protein
MTGKIASRLLLAALFYAVVTPLGLAMRLAGRDSLGLRRRSDAPSYWLARRGERQRPQTSMKRQF